MRCDVLLVSRLMAMSRDAHFGTGGTSHVVNEFVDASSAKLRNVAVERFAACLLQI